MDVVGEVVELEPEVEVREAAVVLRDAISMDARVLGGDGHDAEDAPELDDDGVGARGAGDGQRRRGRRRPHSADDGGG